MTTPPYRSIRMLQQERAESAHGWTELLKPAPPAAGANFTHKVDNNVWEMCRAVTFQLVTSAVAGQRQPLLNYLDPDGFIYDQVVAGPNPGLSSTVTVFLDDHTPTPATAAPSVQANGSVTTPGAGAVIASTPIGAGTWEVQWIIDVDGTPAAADADNMQLMLGAAVILVSQNRSSAGPSVQQSSVVIDVPTGGATLQVQAIGAGTAGANYRAQLSAVQLSGMSYYGQLPSLLMRSGYSLQLAVTGIQAADQIQAIGLYVHRYPSDWASGTTYRDEVAEELALEAALRRGQ